MFSGSNGACCRKRNSRPEPLRCKCRHDLKRAELAIESDALSAPELIRLIRPVKALKKPQPCYCDLGI